MVRASLLLLAMITVIGIFRIWRLNRQYPSPKEIVFHLDQECELSGHRLCLLGMELLEGEEAGALYAGSAPVYYEDGTPYPWERQRVLLATVEIEGTDSHARPLDLTQTVLESGAWSNGMDHELLSALNGEHGSLYVNLEQGEKQTVVCPFLMLDIQFLPKEWETLSVYDFALVVSCYPEKLMLIK